MTSHPASTSAWARARASAAPPTAAATRSRPCWSLLESGYWRRLKMSLMVMRPLRSPCLSTTGSFSMRCLASSRSASSSVVPTGAVISFSFVITSRIGRSSSRSNCKSRFVMMPTSLPAPSTIGTPEILKRTMSCCASRSGRSGPSVIGFMIMPDSLRFTRSTSAACRSIDMFLWMTPMPPWRAIAIAISDSVTVSIAADTIGIFKGMARVKRLVTLTLRGCTVEGRGTSRTSSKVRATSGRKVPMAEVTGGAWFPQPVSWWLPPPPLSRRRRPLRRISPPSPPRPSCREGWCRELDRRASCLPASPRPSETPGRPPRAANTSTRETRCNRGLDRPARPASRRACAGCARSRRRSRRSTPSFERNQIDNGVAEVAAAAVADPRRDRHGGERREGTKRGQLDVRHDHVHETALRQRPASQHVTRTLGDVGPQLVSFLDRDELEIPPQHLADIALRLGTQLRGGHADHDARGRYLEIATLDPAFVLNARPFAIATEHAQRRVGCDGPRLGTIRRPVQRRHAHRLGAGAVRNRRLGIGSWRTAVSAGRCVRGPSRDDVGHRGERAALDPAVSRHVYPAAVLGAIGRDTLQPKSLRQLGHERSGRRGPQILVRGARHQQIEVGTTTRSDGRRKDPAVEDHREPIVPRCTRAGRQHRVFREPSDSSAGDVLVEPGVVGGDAVAAGSLRLRARNEQPESS